MEDLALGACNSTRLSCAAPCWYTHSNATNNTIKGQIKDLNLTQLCVVLWSALWSLIDLRVMNTAFELPGPEVTAFNSAARSAEDLRERVSEQLFCARPEFGLYEDAPDEVSGLLRDVQWQHGVRGLSGYFKNGCHGLVFGPGGLLRQHFHHGAAKTPEHKNTHKK